MKQHAIRTGCALVALVAACGAAAGSLPKSIHYQGRLVDGTNLVSGGVSLVFGLYSAPLGGLPVFVDSNATAVAVDGLYAADIGAHVISGDLVSALAGGATWLEVQVNGVPLSPREQISSAAYALVTGPRGAQNVETGAWSVVGGGLANGAMTNYAAIGGGLSNLVSGVAGTVGGGQENGALGPVSTVGGGYFNGAFGYGSTVPGGVGSAAVADYSLAAGRGAIATNTGALVWGDSQAAYVYSTANDQATFRCAGGVRFTSGVANPNQMVSWAPGQASWSFTSDRAAKENVRALEVDDILRRLCRVPVTEWSYIGYAMRHVGPMAQDFHAAFPFSASDTSLVESDLIGVEWAAIQGLKRQLDEQAAENRALRERLEALDERLNRMTESLER